MIMKLRQLIYERDRKSKTSAVNLVDGDTEPAAETPDVEDDAMPEDYNPNSMWAFLYYGPCAMDYCQHEPARMLIVTGQDGDNEENAAPTGVVVKKEASQSLSRTTQRKQEQQDYRDSKVASAELLSSTSSSESQAELKIVERSLTLEENRFRIECLKTSYELASPGTDEKVLAKAAYKKALDEQTV